MPDNLPAARKAQKPALVAQGALPDLGAVEADHFDGWSLDDVRNWLIDVAPSFARAEMLTEHYRRACGLALYRVLAEEGEKAAAEFTKAVAEHASVSARTVGSWRRAAMDAFSLPPPSRRSAAHLPPPTSHERAKTKPPISAESTDKTPPLGSPDRLPVDEVDPVELVDHAQDERFTKADPPTLPPVNPCPTCKGTGIAPPRRPGEVIPSGRRPLTKAERGPRFTRSNCPHYPNARVGKMCMDCESEIR